MVVIYSFGAFHAATKVVRSDDPGCQADDQPRKLRASNQSSGLFQKIHLRTWPRPGPPR